MNGGNIAPEVKYVSCEECERRMKEHEGKLVTLDRRLALIELQMKINNWLSLTIAGGVIAVVIKLFLKG